MLFTVFSRKDKSSKEFSLVCKVKSVYKLLTDTTRMNVYLNITFGCINEKKNTNLSEV